MPRPRETVAQTTARFRLENHLVLTRYIANRLGLNEVTEIKQFSDVKEGFDSDGRSYMYHAIITRKGNRIPESKLRQYDENIKKYFEHLKRNREEKISIKYYQYLSLLFSEIYLDSYFDSPVKFLNELNEWISTATSEEPFSAFNLKKIAYWMATGSGKTLIMHANYWQFLAYNKGPKKLNFENIILITANDEMSKQHLEELKKSGIPATLFQGETGGYFEGDPNLVKVISIHKLKLPEDKKGEGVTIDVSSIGTKNLVLVDEGHKGHKSEDMKWKKTREKLAKDGFTFEYSATFGQVITSSNEEAFNEYSKSILFDYSYKYFYGDGYGKDFRILNLDSKTFADKHIPILLLANAMAFYEQISEHKSARKHLKDYNIEKPLWVFIGSKVQKETSDILRILEFLNWMLQKDEKTIRELIANILKGNSGITADKKDIFAPRHPERNFVYLRDRRISPDEIYHGIFSEILHITPGIMGRKLHIVNLRNVEGEIGLKAGTSDKYFGVITIGEKPEFLKLVENQAKDIIVETAAISRSLFDEINDESTSINVLIGAKKFIEGWNSWRVSNMCLLNVGKTEGPQIIQLFGRGVRLKGKEYSLKRSRFIPPPHPPYIEVLETLQVFGIQANYMEVFKEIIEREDIPTYELPLPTAKIEPFPPDLQILGLQKGWSFDQERLTLGVEDNVEAKVDLLPRATIIDGREEQPLVSTISQAPKTIRKETLDLLDWDKIFYDILEYKNEREFFNIAISKETLRRIIYEQKYTLLCNQDLIEPNSFESLERVNEIVILLLKKYLASHYSKRRNAAEKRHMELRPLEKTDANLLDSYKIQINEDDKVLIENIDNLIKSGKIYTSASEIKLIGDLRTFIETQPTTFRNVYHRGHLYQPLLMKQDSERVITIPAGLNEGETRFVEDLSLYIDDEHPESEVYLLRNLTRGKGVGFYESHSFYPDFIMWIRKDKKQTVVFIDPKGLTHLGLDDPKLRLHEYLRDEIQKDLNNPNVRLTAFIISVTPYDMFSKTAQLPPRPLETYERDKHLLFQQLKRGTPNKSYIEQLFKIATIDN